MNTEDLIALSEEMRTSSACSECKALVCKGWESLPGGFDVSCLSCVGTLRDLNDGDPSIEEYPHPGLSGWSVDAPIAVGWFPYNRCDVWRCKGCARQFLRYTEFGGYYTDERIRELQTHLIR